MTIRQFQKDSFKSNLWVKLALISAFILIAVYVTVFNHFKQIAPLSDDLSMIAFSRSWSWNWFSQGLANYFIAYPEYYGPQSNFIRPISNLAFWLFHTIFRADDPYLANQIQLATLNYGALLAIATILSSEVRHASQSYLIGFLAGSFALVIPSFWTTPTPTYTSFVFDELATLFCLLAFKSARLDRTVIASLWLIAAFFTKEIAIPISAGFALIFILNKRVSALTMLVVGASIWVALRYYAFGIETGGVYVFSDQSDEISRWLFTKFQNALTLPIGPVFFDDLFIEDNFPSSIFNRSGFLLCLNVAVTFTVLIWGLSTIIKTNRTRLMKWARSSELQAIAAVSSLLAYGFVAYVGANYRYAFIFLPFFLIAVASIVQNFRIKLVMFIALTIGALTASQPSLRLHYFGNPIEVYRYSVMRDLLMALKNRDQSKPVVILNDTVTGYASPEALQILTQHDAKVLRGTSIYLEGCKVEELKSISTSVETTSEEQRILSVLPSCARFIFESATHLNKFVFGDRILRNADIFYKMKQDPRLDNPDLNGYWLGHELTTYIQKKAEFDILYFDFQRNKWIEVKN